MRWGRTLYIRSKNCEAALQGVGSGDDIDVLASAEREVGLREMTWEAVVRLEYEELGRRVKGYCITD